MKFTRFNNAHPSRVLCWVCALLILEACSPSGKIDTSWGNREKFLLIANGDEPQSLDPHRAVGSNDFNILNALFEGLIELHPQSLEVVPGVAESWKISSEATKYTFKIRSNARWSNGDPVTSYDFLFAWQRALQPSSAAAYVSQMFMIKNAEAYFRGEISDFSKVGVRALPEYLEVTLKQPTPYFLDALSLPVFYPLHSKTVNIHADRWTRPGVLVGNGPFTLESWHLNKHVHVARNPNYWDAKTLYLNGIRFFPIEDRNAEERAFRTGKVHLTYTPQLAIEKLSEYRENHPEKLQQTPVYASYYYVINTAQTPFNDARVRNALALAIDRERLVTRVTRGGEAAAGSFIPPAENRYEPVEKVSFNPTLARQLLDESGYPNGANFPTFELLFNNGEIHRKVATAIQQMWWEHLNIRVKLRNMEWKTFIVAQNNKNYVVSRAGWIADYLHPLNFFETLVSNSGNNDTHWANPAYDKLIALAQSTSNPVEMQELLEQANHLLIRDMPVIPLFYPSDNNLVHPYVQGWYPNQLHRHPYKYVKLPTNH